MFEQLQRPHDINSSNERVSYPGLTSPSRHGNAADNQWHQQNEMLEFATITAHDLRNSLTCIISVLEILARKPQDDNLRNRERILDRGLRAADRVEGMLQRLIDIARGGKDPMAFEACQLKDLVAAAVELSLDNAQKKRISISISGHAGLVNCNEMLLVEAIDNLIGNAVKYSRCGTHICCEIRRVKSSVLIHIRDQGQGFTADDLVHFGRPFQKLSARPTGGEKSTGLGLWSVIRIAEMHQGALYVCSDGPEKGATVTLRLPVSA